MIYRVVIIDNEGNEVSLTERYGVWNMEGNPSDEVRFTMEEALEKLKEAYPNER